MTIKLCRDCKWVSNPGEFAHCKAPQNYQDPLALRAAKYTGFKAGTMKERKGYSSCAVHRSQNFIVCRFRPYTCGKEGRWFEPKLKQTGDQT